MIMNEGLKDNGDLIHRTIFYMDIIPCILITQGKRAILLLFEKKIKK